MGNYVKRAELVKMNKELMARNAELMAQLEAIQKDKDKKAVKKSTKKAAPKKPARTQKEAEKIVLEREKEAKNAKKTSAKKWMTKDEYKAQFSEAERMAYGQIARTVKAEMLAEARASGNYWEPKEYKAELKARINARLGKEAK